MMCAPSIGFVHFSCINGEVVVEDGVLKTADVAQVVAAAEAASARLLEGVTDDVLGIKK